MTINLDVLGLGNIELNEETIGYIKYGAGVVLGLMLLIGTRVIRWGMRLAKRPESAILKALTPAFKNVEGWVKSSEVYTYSRLRNGDNWSVLYDYMENNKLVHSISAEWDRGYITDLTFWVINGVTVPDKMRDSGTQKERKVIASNIKQLSKTQEENQKVASVKAKRDKQELLSDFVSKNA